jgi:transcriptional antiterminator RfaH
VAIDGRDPGADASRVALWYAVQTKPRHEERAEANLLAWGVEAFLPRIRSASLRRVPHGASSHVEPLFPNYLFARFDVAAMAHKIRYTRGVTRILAIDGRPTPIDDGIITLIRDRIDSGGYVLPTSRLAVGDRVRVTAGPLKDLVGVFEAPMKATRRVRLLLAAVRGQVRVEVDEGLLEKVTEATLAPDPR